MNRTHGEPERVPPRRCVDCGLPRDPAEARRLVALAEERGANETWHWCGTCGMETCKLLQRICAEEAERG